MVYNAMPPLNLKHCEDIKTTNTTTIPFIIIIEIPKQKKNEMLPQYPTRINNETPRNKLYNLFYSSETKERT